MDYIKNKLLDITSRWSKKTKSPHNLSLLSYHIPKTAGSSLRVMLENEFGKRQVFGAYAKTGANELTKGQATLVPANTRVIHGHFRPHISHFQLYPEATSMVWVRDPVERIWSLTGHLMSLGFKHPHYASLSEMYIEKGIESQADIVRDIVENNTIPYMTHAYRRFFSNIPIDSISFVGSVHKFEHDVERFNKEFKLSLQPTRRNVRSNGNVPANIKSLSKYMPQEYEIVENYL